MNIPISTSEFLASVDAAVEELMITKRVTAILVAERIGISAQRLNRYMKSAMGISSSAYIDNYRVEHAKKLLLSNNMQTVGSVGHECGFEEPTHFVRFFKRVAGITPREYRRQHKI